MNIPAAQARMTFPVKVQIALDEKSGYLTVTPSHLILNSVLKNEIQVTCLLEKAAQIEIAFDPKDTPFRNYRFLLKGNSKVLSGVPRPEKTRETPYKCTVRVLNADPKSPANVPVACTVMIN
ncbi:MAG TPA: hypothetical protein VFZ34_16720 [Blastocatellia bacterium]|nr:hypothetical protein [Blastocatellia bacterium]